MGGRERRQGAEQRRANCPPTRRRTDAAARPSSPASAVAATDAGSTWPQRRHRAQLARQGMARRDEAAGARVRSRTARICPLTLSGRPTLGRRRWARAVPHAPSHTGGQAREEYALGGTAPWRRLRATTEARAMEHKHAQDWNTNEAKADAADDATQLALTGTAGRGARPRDTRG
ncbi:hypothetical protein ERJ75_001725300 [Trypanosoma vivax]|nr:hypothetical protein ERJ75_001725300 [Trypanosoma vivax]